MNLCASLVVRNELARYLEPCIDHLLAFCDTVVVIDDDSDDGTLEWLLDYQPTANTFVITGTHASTFFKHEGRTRQRLLDMTLEQNPTHVLNLDADEFVSDGAALRARIGSEPDVAIWSLDIEEVWNAGDKLSIREDGGWRSHPISVLWRVDPTVNYRIMDRALSCRRVPTHILNHAGSAVPTGESLLHLGWSNPVTRRERYERYVRHDGGKFHARRHLQSIMWPDDVIELREREWPAGLHPYREAILERVAQTV